MQTVASLNLIFVLIEVSQFALHFGLLIISYLFQNHLQNLINQILAYRKIPLTPPLLPSSPEWKKIDYNHWYDFDTLLKCKLCDLVYLKIYVMKYIGPLEGYQLVSPEHRLFFLKITLQMSYSSTRTSSSHSIGIEWIGGSRPTRCVCNLPVIKIK